MALGEVSQAFEQLAGCIVELNNESESKIKSCYSRMAVVTSQCSVQWEDSEEEGEIEWVLLLQELGGYLSKALLTFEGRSALIIEKEKLEKELSQLQIEREVGSSNTPSLSLIFLYDKLDQLKGT